MASQSEPPRAKFVCEFRCSCARAQRLLTQTPGCSGKAVA